MKTHLLTHIRIPTKDPYAYLEVEFLGTTDDALDEYNRLTSLIKGESGAGLERKQFNDMLDLYLAGEPIPDGTELWAQMNGVQQAVFQEIKKSKARTNK